MKTHLLPHLNGIMPNMPLHLRSGDFAVVPRQRILYLDLHCKHSILEQRRRLEEESLVYNLKGHLASVDLRYMKL
jgi:hypothetical protein